MFLQSMGPLLMTEPFKSYGLLLEEFLQLVEDNMNFDYNGLTLENLVERLPIMRDLFTSLNMNADVFKLLMAAPFKHPNAMMDLVNSADIGKELCSSSSKFWQEILDWNSLSPTGTPISFDYCNQTETEFFQKLVQDLKLTNIVEILNEMNSNNSTKMPDWKKLIEESMNITAQLQRVMNSSSGIDISKTLDYLNSLYQNDVLAATNFTRLYAQLQGIMGNTPEWEMIDNVFRSQQIMLDFLNGIFDRVGVPSGKIDLGMLFKNTTRIKAMLQAVHIDEDFIVGLFLGSMKYDKVCNIFFMKCHF